LEKETRQCTTMSHWGASCNHCCRGKATIIHILIVCVCVCVRVCSLSRPACNAHASYGHVVCPAIQYFSTLPHKRHNFRGKKLLNIKYLNWFSVQYVWNVFRSEQNWATYDHKRTLVFMYSTVILVIFKCNLNLFDRLSKEYTNIKCHKNPSSRSRVVPYGRADGQTDVTKLLVAFHNSANAPKNGQDAAGIIIGIYTPYILYLPPPNEGWI
jgi:hypothetical protein